MRKPITEKYNAVFGRVLRFLGVKGAMSLWRTIWLAKHPLLDGRLSPEGRRHEEYHLLSPNQWAGHPYTFPFRYIAQYLATAWRRKTFKNAYDCMNFELDARQVGGQVSRCPGVTIGGKRNVEDLPA